MAWFDFIFHNLIVYITISGFIFVAQLKPISSDLIGYTIETKETSSSFKCLSFCIDNIECIAVQTILFDGNKIKCLLKNDTRSSIEPKESQTENFILDCKLT